MDKARDYHRRLFLEAWYSQRDQNVANERRYRHSEYSLVTRVICYVAQHSFIHRWPKLANERPCAQVTQQSKNKDLYGKNGYILKPKKYEEVHV